MSPWLETRWECSQALLENERPNTPEIGFPDSISSAPAVALDPWQVDGIGNIIHDDLTLAITPAQRKIEQRPS